MRTFRTDFVVSQVININIIFNPSHAMQSRQNARNDSRKKYLLHHQIFTDHVSDLIMLACY